MPSSVPASAAFPFGSVYLLEPEYSAAEIERDVALMADHGFDLLTLWPVANSWLAKDPAEFVFTDTLRFLDLCHARGMKVMLQLVGQNPAQEFTPDCLLRPDLLLNPLPGSIWANLSHPEVQQLARNYFDACIGALAHHPAVFGWDIFNESNFRSEDPHTVLRYQAWLEKRYCTIDNLNRRWLRRFRSFDQIHPGEHRANYSTWSSQLPPVEIEAFHADNLTAICREWADYVKKIDPAHPVVVDGTSAQLLYTDLSQRNSDEFETAKNCDIYGGTFYPKSWGRDMADRPWELLLYYSIPRAAAVKAGKPYFINELQTHTQTLFSPGSEMSRADLRLYIWAALAAGGEAMQLWRWRPFLRGYQSTGRGLTSLDGTPGPRADEVKQLVAQLRRLQPELSAVKSAAPDVTLLLGYRSRLFYDAFLRWAPSTHPDIVRGWHRAFAALGLAVECGSIEHLDEADRRTPVLVLPALISLSDAQVAWLARYVAEGGCLVADARLNALDDMDQARKEGSPGHVLAEVFGLIEADVGPASTYIWDGATCRAPFLTQQLTVRPGAQVLARDPAGHPMVVAHRHGKGRTLYFASMQGLSLWHDKNPALLPVLRAQFPEFAAHFVEKPEHTVVRWHEGEDTVVCFVLNFAKTDSIVRFARPPAAGGVEIITGESFGGDAFNIPAESVRLLRWERPPRRVVSPPRHPKNDLTME